MARPHLIAAVVAVLAVALPAPVALGHSEVTGVHPAGGATLSAAPTSVVVTYGEPVARAASASLTVDGRPADAGAPRLDPSDSRRVRIPIAASGPGVYRVLWSVVAADGDAVAGRTTFTVTPGPVIVVARRVGAAITRVCRLIEERATR
jgi:methionine-rich copper-binding protein CopC